MHRIRVPLFPIALMGLIAQGNATAAQSPDIKVVGGKTAGHYGFMAAVGGEPDDEPFCGGSFIRKDVVLTAAHCVYRTRETFWVGANVRNRYEIDEHHQVPVKGVIVHPDYDPNELKNDLALLFLDANVMDERGLNVEPIALDDGTPMGAGELLTAIGWGNATSEGRYFEAELQEVDLPPLSNDVCRRSGPSYESIEASQLCAGDIRTGGRDTCQGDSGGPLFRSQAGTHSLAGIVSWGEGCAEPGNPGVYTRVASFRDWVHAMLTRYDALAHESPGANLDAILWTFCYQGFAVAEDIEEGDNILAATRWLDPVGAFTHASKEDLTLASRTLCSFALPGGREVNASVVGERTPRPYLLVESNGETWRSELGSYLGLDMACSHDGARSVIEMFEAEGHGRFRSAGDHFKFSPQRQTRLPSSAVKRDACTLGSVTYEHFVDGVGRDARHYLALATDLLAETRTHALTALAPGRPERMPEIPLDLDVTMTSATDGRMKVENHLRRPVFGWQIACNFAFTLRDAAGNDFPSGERKTGFTVQFSAADETHGTLPASGSLDFAFTSQEALDLGDETKGCRINGYAVNLGVE